MKELISTPIIAQLFEGLMSFVFYMTALSALGALNLTLSLLLMWRGAPFKASSKQLFNLQKRWLWGAWYLSITLFVATFVLFLDEHRGFVRAPEVWLCVIAYLSVWVWVELRAHRLTSERDHEE